MNTKKADSYLVMKVFAYIAAAVASIATYDIAYHFSPPAIDIAGFILTKAYVGIMTVLTLDGLYVLLDDRLPHFKTENARDWAVRFLFLLWAVMLSLNISSGVMNNTMDTSVLGRFSFVVYAVKVVSLIYLAFYTYIRTDDPDTKRVVIENQLHWTRAEGINRHLQNYSAEFAREGAKIIAMHQLSELVLKETGKEIQDILGADWQVKIGGEVFVKPAAGKPIATGKTASPAAATGNDKTPPPPSATGNGKGLVQDIINKGAEYLNEIPRRLNIATGKKAPKAEAEPATGNVATGNAVNP